MLVFPVTHMPPNLRDTCISPQRTTEKGLQTSRMIHKTHIGILALGNYSKRKKKKYIPAGHAQPWWSQTGSPDVKWGFEERNWEETFINQKPQLSLNAQIWDEVWHGVPYRLCCVKYTPPCKLIVYLLFLKHIAWEEETTKAVRAGRQWGLPGAFAHCSRMCLTSVLVSVPCPALSPHKYKKVWPVISHQKYHFGIHYVIFPF